MTSRKNQIQNTLRTLKKATLTFCAFGMLVCAFVFQNCQRVGFSTSTADPTLTGAKDSVPAPKDDRLDETQLPTDYSFVGGMSNYPTLQFRDDQNVSMSLNWTTGKASGTVCSGSCRTKLCELPQGAEKLKNILSQASVCIHHKKMDLGNSACTLSFALGYATAILSSSSNNTSLPQQIYLGGDAPGSANECHSSYVLCADTNFQSFIAAKADILKSAELKNCQP